MKLLSPIQAFIFASIGIHGSLFVMSDSTKITLPGSTGSVMSIKLKEQNDKPIQPETKAAQNKKVKNTIHQAKVSNNTSKIPNIKINSEKELNKQLSENKITNAKSKAYVISIIYKQLHQHFKYPRIAQKRNWQGQVLLSFHITNKGNIKDIKINHSSGYTVLDQAAIISLQRIGQLPKLTTWLNSGMDIQIPIIYQLTES